MAALTILASCGPTRADVNPGMRPRPGGPTPNCSPAANRVRNDVRMSAGLWRPLPNALVDPAHPNQHRLQQQHQLLALRTDDEVRPSQSICGTRMERILPTASGSADGQRRCPQRQPVNRPARAAAASGTAVPVNTTFAGSHIGGSGRLLQVRRTSSESRAPDPVVFPSDDPGRADPLSAFPVGAVTRSAIEDMIREKAPDLQLAISPATRSCRTRIPARRARRPVNPLRAQILTAFTGRWARSRRAGGRLARAGASSSLDTRRTLYLLPVEIESADWALRPSPKAASPRVRRQCPDRLRISPIWRRR